MRWTDQTGTVRTARVDKCALIQDGSTLTIAYCDPHDYEQAQSVCGPSRLVASTLVAVFAGGAAAQLLWPECRTLPLTDEEPHV